MPVSSKKPSSRLLGKQRETCKDLVRCQPAFTIGLHFRLSKFALQEISMRKIFSESLLCDLIHAKATIRGCGLQAFYDIL